MQVLMQIGKNGLTRGVIDAVKVMFKKHENVELRILKSFSRDREVVRKTIEQLISDLGNEGFFTYRIVGFKVFIKKWRKKPKDFDKK